MYEKKEITLYIAFAICALLNEQHKKITIFEMIFISYSRHDIEWKDELLTQFSGFDDGKFKEQYVWADDKIRAGEIWNDVLTNARNNTHIAIMLVTAEFLASKFIRDNELRYFLERRKKVRIYWFLVSDCAALENSGLLDLQCANGANGSDIVPLSKMQKTEAKTVFSRECRKIYYSAKNMLEDVSNFHSSERKCPTALAFYCNRDMESALIKKAYNSCGNVLCFASSGDEDDCFGNFSKTVIYKSLDCALGDEQKIKEVIIRSIFIDPLLVKYTEKFVSFLMGHIQELTIDASRLSNYSIIDLYQNYASPQKKDIIIFSINISSADFHKQKFNCIIDWIKNDFSNNTENTCPLKVIFLFNLIKAKSTSKWKYIKMKWHIIQNCVYVSKRNYSSVLDRQLPVGTILYLGEHSKVTQTIYDRWYNEHFAFHYPTGDEKLDSKWRAMYSSYGSELFTRNGKLIKTAKIKAVQEKLDTFINSVNINTPKI